MALDTEEVERRASSGRLSSESGLFSAIHSSIAQGEEANRRQEQEQEQEREEQEKKKGAAAAARLFHLETYNAVASCSSNGSGGIITNGHSLPVQVSNGINSLPHTNGGDAFSNRHHALDQPKQAEQDKVTPTKTALTAAQTTNRSPPDREPHRAPDGFRYTPMRDLAAAPVVAAHVDETMQVVERSLSVSYVDPYTDLHEEQGREDLDAMITDYAAQNQREQQRCRSGSPVSIGRDRQATPKAASVDVDVKVKPTSSSSPSAPVNGSRTFVAESPAFDGGWGISASQQHTPAPTTTSYEEYDELEEASRQSHRSNEPSSSRVTSDYTTTTFSPVLPSTVTGASDGATAPFNAAASPPPPSSPTRADKGKGRAVDSEEMQASCYQDMETQQRVDYEVNTTHRSPTREEKGKQRARTATPPPLSTLHSSALASQAMANSDSPGTRPAKVGRKFRGIDRLKKAACGALMRDEAFLDFHTETGEADGKTTCWIRCINWDSDDGEDDAGEATEGSDEDAVNVTTERAAAGAHAPKSTTARLSSGSTARGRGRGRGRGRSKSRVRSNAPSSEADLISSSSRSKGRQKGPPRIASCAAEVLADLIDEEQDKWRVAAMNDEHSAACNAMINELATGEDLPLPDYLNSVDDDYEAQLAAAIHASQQPADEGEDSDLTRALHFSQFDGPHTRMESFMSIGVPSPEPQSTSTSVQATARSTVFQPSVPASTAENQSIEVQLPEMEVDQVAEPSLPTGGDVVLQQPPEHPTSTGVAAMAESTTSPEQTQTLAPAAILRERDSYTEADQEASTAATQRSPTPPPPPATSQSFLQRIYNTLNPSRPSPQHRCVTGDSFASSHDFLKGAARALSLPASELYIRKGNMYGTAYQTVLCFRHKDLTSEERTETGLPVDGIYDCEATVKAFQQTEGGSWRVGNILYRHSPACEKQRAAPLGEAPSASAESHSEARSPQRTEASIAMTAQISADSSASSSDRAGDNSSNSTVIRRLMTFDDLQSLRRAALEALGREADEVEIKEGPHAVFPAQRTCNIYCKNYSFGQPQTNRSGWALIRQRSGISGGGATQCMAFVESSKRAVTEPWRIGHFSLQHTPRCQLEHDEAQPAEQAVPPPRNEDSATSGAQANRTRDVSRLGPYEPLPLGDDGLDQSDGGESPNAFDSTSDNFQDSDVEFVSQVEGPPPPMIKVGDRYPTRHSFKAAAQKLSHYLNKGSKVEWTGKKENKPTKLACRNGPGYYQDRTSGVLCNFRIESRRENSRRVVATRVYAEHSPECKVAHGNSTSKDPASSVPAATISKAPSSKARKTATAKPNTRIRRVGLAKRTSNESRRRTSGDEQSSDIDDGQQRAHDNAARANSSVYSRTSQDRDIGPEHAESSQAAQMGRNGSLAARPARSEGSHRSSVGRSKGKKPPRPRADAIYNSLHHFIAAVEAYSSWRSPAADLRRQNGMNNKKKGGYMVLYCSSYSCPFRISGRNLRDDRGRELEGFQIKEAVTHHNSDCRARDPAVKTASRASNSKSVSVAEIESSAADDAGSVGDTQPLARPWRKRRIGEDGDTAAVKARRIVQDSDVSLPPPLSAQRSSQGSFQEAGITQGDPPPAASSDTSARGVTPVTQSQHTVFDDSEDDIRDFLAHNQPRIKEEPSSPERLSNQIRLFTGRLFGSREEFVDTVLRHTEERNPGCQLSVANTDPARVRVYCRRPDCQYSFNSVYEHGARQVPAVKVTANHREHSASCIAYYRSLRQEEQRVHFDPPVIDQDIGDWHDFESAVQAHTDSVNPGCELKTTNRENNCRVYCPHLDLGCRYSFTARFDIPELMEGRVLVTKVQSGHSQGCLEHHARIALEEAEEEAALNPGVATKRINPRNADLHFPGSRSGQGAPSRRGPGPHVGDDFEDEEAFKEAVERHSQSVNPGSLLGFRRPTVNNCQMQCKLWHTGCRYEFYAALHPPAPDGSRKVVITDITPEHHEMCVAELVLRGRRTAPDYSDGPRTRRGRASLPTTSSQAGQSLISPARPKAETSKARKTSHKRRSLGTYLDDSDSESGRLLLRESNLMNHTSMNIARDAGNQHRASPRVGRPPLIPPSQFIGGRPPLIPPAPSRPVKRARFEDSSSSHASEASAKMEVEEPVTTVEPDTVADSSNVSANPASAGDVSLRDIMDSDEADRLEQAGYTLVSHLVRIGVQREDWPDLHLFLSARNSPLAGNAVTDRRPPALGAGSSSSLDPIEEFLLTRRARLAFIEESEGSYRQSSEDEADARPN